MLHFISFSFTSLIFLCKISAALSSNSLHLGPNKGSCDLCSFSGVNIIFHVFNREKSFLYVHVWISLSTVTTLFLSRLPVHASEQLYDVFYLPSMFYFRMQSLNNAGIVHELEAGGVFLSPVFLAFSVLSCSRPILMTNMCSLYDWKKQEGKFSPSSEHQKKKKERK